MIYVLVTLVLCLLYNYLLFRLLGKWRFRVTLGLLLAGAVLCVVSWYAMEGLPMLIVMSAGGVMSVCMVGCLLNHIEEWQQLRRARQLAALPARKLKSCSDVFMLSREDMLQNFRELAAKDELAVCSPESHYLAWNDEQGSDIRLHLLSDEDWLGLLYVTDGELRDSEIKAACEKAGLRCPREALGMAPSGLVICRSGQLTITPASQKKYFDSLRKEVLAPRAEFSTWLSEYCDE